MLPQNEASKVLVLFSGGQDSATVLAWACANFAIVETIGFDYGQRHHVEFKARDRLRSEFKKNFPIWGERLGVDHFLNIETFGALSQTAMTQDAEIIVKDDGLPNTFVPGRNLVFLVYAGALAWRRGVSHIAAGMCETDFSGYPDCREETLHKQMEAINMGMETEIKLFTPLMALNKAQCWHLTEDLGGEELVEIIRVDSHTCYKGKRDKIHPWGYGCGSCPACHLRANGWHTYKTERMDGPS